MMDYAKRYPEAKALKCIDSNTFVEALFQMFCRVGWLYRAYTQTVFQSISGPLPERKGEREEK